MKRKVISAALLSLLIVGETAAARKPSATFKRAPEPTVQTHVDGYLGGRIDACIRVRVMSEDENLLVAPFRQRNETNRWQSEFGGKWTLGAIGAYRYNRDPQLLQKIGNGVSGLLSTQSEDGYIGNYAPEAQLTNWDVWGQKYTLLGLLAYYDLTGDKKAIEGACKLADRLMTVIPAKKEIEMAGIYRGLPPSSILEPIVYLYNRTGNGKYLDFAKYIVGRWETDKGPQLIGKALAGVPVAERFPFKSGWETWCSWDNGQKAYEMMSCYDGLLELYKITKNPDYLKAVEATVRNIIDEEINIAGSGSAFECFYHGKRLQTDPAYHTMETCVTMTWMKLCQNLLDLTKNPLYADQIEKTTYNALLAALKEDAGQIAKYSPLEGVRSAGEHQCGMHVNCCNSNGPRAFAMIPTAAVLSSNDSLFVNLYGPSTTKASLGKNEISLEQTTAYPEDGDIEIAVNAPRNLEFAVAVRIPAWSKVSRVAVNGESIGDVRPGTYVTVRRRWEPGDKISVNLDMRGRLVELNGYQAIERGPIVLARDSRFDDGFVDEASVIQANADGYVELMPVTEADKPEKMWMVYTAPLVLGTDLEGDFYKPRQIRFCDFASAGNTWDRRIRYRVWLKKTYNVILAPQQ